MGDSEQNASIAVSKSPIRLLKGFSNTGTWFYTYSVLFFKLTLFTICKTYFSRNRCKRKANNDDLEVIYKEEPGNLVFTCSCDKTKT